MIAVLFNTLTVLIGSLVGLTARRLVSKRISDAIMIGLGICTVYIGFSGALAGKNTLVLVLSIVFGGAFGTALDLDARLNALGEFFSRLVNKRPGPPPGGRAGRGGDVVQAFVSSSLLFCVGSMTIVGSLNAGLTRDYELLFTKSIMDLFSSTMLAASLGVGVLFSAIFVLVFEGGICLLAGVLAPYLNEYARGEMISAGSIVIVLLGFNILRMTRFKVIDYLPAIVIAPLLCAFIK